MSQRVVAGRFVLQEPLGQGGMGTVWRAQDQILGRTVALKEVSLPPSVPQEERQAMRQRVLREARAAAKLNHPAAVTVFDVIEEGDNTFIAMEIVESPTLAQLVTEEGTLSPDRAASIGLRVLEALEAAHGHGIVHRDVKPANVIVGEEHVKLADFGVASVKGDPRLTATGLLLGSPSYMSPEQVEGKAAGPPSDLWALGATMYFAVEGRGPFDRPGPLPTLMAISKEDLTPPEHAGPLTRVIVSLLNKDPDRRPLAGRLRIMLEDVIETSLPAAEGAYFEKPDRKLGAAAGVAAAGVGASTEAMAPEPEAIVAKPKPVVPGPEAQLLKPGPSETAEPAEPSPAAAEVEVLAGINEQDTETWPDELPETAALT
ncbi:MAG TPA: serine/threonine-protein kinase, partial [Actinomycetota bacterium]|nr:serine/threonine-protein kinase [Actinomycetota bacterium]